jgi:hypothetical protein
VYACGFELTRWKRQSPVLPTTETRHLRKAFQNFEVMSRSHDRKEGKIIFFIIPLAATRKAARYSSHFAEPCVNPWSALFTYTVFECAIHTVRRPFNAKLSAAAERKRMYIGDDFHHLEYVRHVPSSARSIDRDRPRLNSAFANSPILPRLKDAQTKDYAVQLLPAQKKVNGHNPARRRPFTARFHTSRPFGRFCRYSPIL